MGKIYSLMDESTAGFTSVEIVNTFADLPPAADHYGEIYGVNTTTGSLLWPPTYKPKGMYLSNGTEWIKQPVPGFATQAETNAGVIDDKTISPKTLAGAGIISDKNFTFTQATASAIWNVVHNLGKYPSVSILDTAGTEIGGEVENVSINEINIKFNAPFSGVATLN